MAKAHVKCPNCGHEITVTLSSSIDVVPYEERYRRSVEFLRRQEPPRIEPTRIDPDRPVSR